MPWYAVLMIVLVVISSAIVVWKVGEPKEPSTPLEVLITLTLNAGFIWGIVALAEHCG